MSFLKFRIFLGSVISSTLLFALFAGIGGVIYAWIRYAVSVL